MSRLAIITSHPIQYYAPWFRYLQTNTNLNLRVFYLLDSTVTNQADRQFKGNTPWDIPLLEGYDYEFVPNMSKQPGTGHFWGLQNPTLTKQVNAFQPDVVLMMNYNYASLYRFLACWRYTPLLFRGDSHRLIPEMGLKAALKRQWITQVYRRFDGCLYVGQANREYFQYHGVEEERLFFSPHAIDNERFASRVHPDFALPHPKSLSQRARDFEKAPLLPFWEKGLGDVELCASRRVGETYKSGMHSAPKAKAASLEAKTWKKDLGIPYDHRVILFAGKLIPKKRPLDLLQAFLTAKLSNVSLLFVGSGELENVLKQQAQSSGNSHIYFAPFQNQSQMPRTYAAGDVMVLPSYGAGETWGLAVNEAFCLGVPVIVSNHVGCASDLVIPQKTGLVFPAGDVDALSRSLQTAFSDGGQKLEPWGKNGQQHISNYSYHHATEGLLGALSALSKSWGTRSSGNSYKPKVIHPQT